MDPQFNPEDLLYISDFYYIAIKTTKDSIFLKSTFKIIYGIITIDDIQILIVNSENEMSILMSQIASTFGKPNTSPICGQSYCTELCIEDVLNRKHELKLYMNTVDEIIRQNECLDATRSVSKLRIKSINQDSVQPKITRKQRNINVFNHNIRKFFAGKNFEYYFDILIPEILVEGIENGFYLSLNQWRQNLVIVLIKYLNVCIDASDLINSLMTLSRKYYDNEILKIQIDIPDRDSMMVQYSEHNWNDITKYTPIEFTEYLQHQLTHRCVKNNDLVLETFNNCDCPLIFVYEPLPRGMFSGLIYNTPQSEEEQFICNYLSRYDETFIPLYREIIALLLMSCYDDSCSLLPLDLMKIIVRILIVV